ncbi:hypothetical protein RR46_00897 [Papilio xuthus]|uniref:Uncharacterized protein n=1 Tax=Papilio xuthus TaxID=66420 RepID=A0A0N1IMT5_PAPXU|nr:hypothetical protein RR46_00897 [Papilio xuthus]
MLNEVVAGGREDAAYASDQRAGGLFLLGCIFKCSNFIKQQQPYAIIHAGSWRSNANYVVFTTLDYWTLRARQYSTPY